MRRQFHADTHFGAPKPAIWAIICRVSLMTLLALASAAVAVKTASAKEAQWIWSPAYEKELAPAGSCYFRKTFNLTAPESGRVEIACDDSYELFVNGRQVGAGLNWKTLDSYDITKLLAKGPNTIAIKGLNTKQGSAGLVARVIVKQQGNTFVEYSSDATWKTTLKEFPQWEKQRFDDAQWLAARSFGASGSTLPWGNEVAMAGAENRFKLAPEFHVEWVVDPEETGSLICMTFDELGQIVAARENGPLVIIRDDDKDGLVETVSTYCEQLKNCQGLLAVGGKMFAVGEGPDGTAVYRLHDEDHDGKIDRVETILKFAGEMGEHGPHALALGPDGLVYMLIGNFSRVSQEFAPTSPYHDVYEGDLVTPKFEDASGHAVGIKAPGGSILRFDTAGKKVELFAGGLQNPYDLAFNAEGELFTCDSDMEWDSGMPWYRPTRVNHVIPGAEFGWRSGWSKWPNYFVDSLPPALEMGRGSPAGMEVYTHHMFPKRYHNALFVCDWSRGRILAIRSKPHGATYKPTAEVFVEGQPLNVTDIAVAPDGWLYFCTGGRDTEGGIYRIVWDGLVPPEVTRRGKGIAGALDQPQIGSAWARQQVLLVKKQLGEKWNSELTGAAEDVRNSVARRTRALDLMQLFGPAPPRLLLVEISHDRDATLRAKAAYLMGLHVDRATQGRLVELLDDDDFGVQRIAAEALVRAHQPISPDALVGLLASPDRHLAWAAGRALQEIPREDWEPAILRSSDARVFVHGAMALLTAADPPKGTIDGVLERSRRLLKAYLNDDEFLDLLRVIELALLKGDVKGDRVAALRTALSEEYPSRDYRMNRELVRLLVYLQEPSFAARLVEQLGTEIPSVEKMQLLMHARYLQAGWSTPLKLEVLRAFEEARTIQGGHSFAGYIENVSREFFAGFDDDERNIVLAEGSKWPSSALSVLAKLEKPNRETLAQLSRLDQQVKRLDTEAAKKLRIGICAVLGTSGDPEAMKYLRGLYEVEPDRRVTIAMALAQQPDGENWPVLVRSLSIVEGAAAQEVLIRLSQVNKAPEEAEAFRQVILRGLMLREGGNKKAIELLEKWTDQKLGEADEAPDKMLIRWQEWFIAEYPDSPEPMLPVENEQNHWTYQELLAFLSGPEATKGTISRGAELFEKAQCARCHRYGDRGDTIGPDLTNISKRFQKKEILESILFPSHVISDQYASQTIVTSSGRSYVGLVSPSGDGELTVLQANGEKVVIAEEDVDQMSRNKTSSMPDGLLNLLNLEEIADLFAYLNSPTRSEVTRRPGKTR